MPNLDDFLIASDDLAGMFVELDRLDWQPVLVVQRVDRDRVAHIVRQHFTLLSAYAHLEGLRWLEGDSSDFLSLHSLGELQSVSLFLLVGVPELDLGVNSATRCQFQSR